MTKTGWKDGHPIFRPLPKGVVEVLGQDINVDGSIIELADGSLMLAQGGGIFETAYDKPICRISKDGGKTWGDAQQLNCDIGAAGFIRLASGSLALYGQKNAKGGSGVYFSSSADDGQTWGPGVPIHTYQDFRPMYHSLTQLSSGRLLLVGYWEGLDCRARDIERITLTNWGRWRGEILWMEGHRSAEMGICLAYYSDDEGRTWKQCTGGLFGWFNELGEPDGTLGITGVYEPTAAETKDGRVLMFARCKRGRLVQSYSLDGGDTWLSIQPTELSSSQSPPMLVRIPQTGDLLCVWNQVSAEEIRRGFSRCRLSAAVSNDNGLTWRNFRTIELMQGLEDVASISPEWPIPAVMRGRLGLGQLPDAFANFDYSNVDIVGDRVFLRYHRTWPMMKEEALPEADNVPSHITENPMWPRFEDRKAEMTGEGVLRIYPLDYFYE